jgi:hypothetical protein
MLIMLRGSIYFIVSLSYFYLLSLLLVLIYVGIVVASDVCRDLVLYDIPKHNPFRQLIPLAHQHPILLQIIIANSALHMSNACQKSFLLGSSSPDSSSSVKQLPDSYNDALAAKQKALYLLQSALTSIASVDVDVTLAVVLLFIEFELIDSGRDNWRYHINGARTIIETLCGSNITTQTDMSPLRSCLISNCLVYVNSKHILYTY